MTAPPCKRCEAWEAYREAWEAWEAYRVAVARADAAADAAPMHTCQEGA